MTMTERDDDLDDLFAAARADTLVPSDALMARIAADAASVAAARRRPAVRAQRGGLLSGLFAALGGWPALGGLAAATVAGFWIGVAPPVGLQSLTSTVFGDVDVTVSLFASDDIVGSEG
jgi:hypothetical protein